MEWSNIWPALSAVAATVSIIYLMLRNLKADLKADLKELKSDLKGDIKSLQLDVRNLDVRISHIEGYLVGARDRTGS